MRKPLGVGSQQSMGIYLGCPMDVDGRNTSCFSNTHDRIVKSISSWSYSCLSAIGRCTLINSVLTTLATHIMSIYLFPKKLLNKLNSTILRFYWGGGGNKAEKPIYWKKQNVLELRKEEGGIVWRINRRPDSLVSRILQQKCGGSPLHVARKTRTPINSSWAYKSMVKCVKLLLPGCGKRIGNGQNMSILEETWAGNSPVRF
ncbi:hypothetical protein RDABS01_029828 [Bienertia sinuspersici]